jgi:hypothetical protein
VSDKHRNATLRAATAAFIDVMLPAIIEPIREVARHHGYAVAVHGSLARDIDLIAVPWTEHAHSPDELVRSIRGAVAGVLGSAHVHADREDGGLKWADKPHGRRAITIIHAGFVGDIDLSVMPLVPKIEEES